MSDNLSNDPFEDIFRERFSNFEAEPANTAWENIYEKINTNQRIKIPFWCWPIAAMLAVGVFLLWPKNEENTKILPLEKAIINEKKEELGKGISYEAKMPLSQKVEKKPVIKLRTEKLSKRQIVTKEDIKQEAGQEINSQSAENQSINNSFARNEALIAKAENLSEKEQNKVVETKTVGLSKNEVTGTKVIEPLGIELGNPKNIESNVLITNELKRDEVKESILSNLKNRPYKNLVALQMPILSTQNIEIPVIKIDRIDKRKSRVEAFASIMPLFSYASIKPNTEDNLLVQNISLAGQLDQSRLGLIVQVGARWPITKKILIRTAFNYTQLNQKVNYQSSSINPVGYNTQIVDNQSINVSPVYQTNNLTSALDWQLVGFGLGIEYEVFTIGKTKHYLTLGRDINGKLIKDGLNRLNGFVNVSYRLAQNLSNGMALSIEPTLNYSLRGKTDQHGLLTLQPYGMGLKFSIAKTL